VREGEWHIDGQKIWTSLAHVADWCFLLARTEPLDSTGPGADRHRGLSCLLVPVRQPGIEIRPIVQITGTAEFNEVFFDDARTPAGNVAGEQGDGWRVALGMLGVERGVSNFGQLVGFQREFEAMLAAARGNGSIADPDIAGRIADAWIGLQVMRFTTEDTLAVPDPGAVAGGVAVGGVAANIAKLLWAPWHQRLGELAVDVTGADATLAGPGYDLTDAQRRFLFTRAETIFGGSNEIQRNIVAERGLGLPRG
jgi:alkylation response protein AidB-like acyl-CoA dehydrogenase